MKKCHNLSHKINMFLSAIGDGAIFKEIYDKLRKMGFKYTEREVSAFLAYVLYPKYIDRIENSYRVYIYSKRAKI